MASSRQLPLNPAQYFRPKPPSLKIREEISRGAYGSVHCGELDGRPVAVKRLHRLLLEAASGQGDFEQMITDFKRECQLLEKLDHPHVVDFCGAFYDETTDEPVLVMERMRENLREFLERNRNELSPQKQLQICLEITRGLRFLHTHTPPIVHRDLTDKNVMFGKDGLVKIGDLGQSRLKANNAEYFNTAQPGAIPFMSPEAMQEQSRYNEKLDIFSLGVLMLEVATQQPPRVGLVGIGRDKEILRRREDLSKLEEDHPLKPLILSCLKDDPKKRPDIVTVHTQLLAMVEGVEEVLPQSPLPPSLGKEVHSVKLPDMPVGAVSYAATIHNSKVYIRAMYNDETGKTMHPLLVYSTSEHKWNIFKAPEQHKISAIAVVNNRIALIGGCDEADEVTSTVSTWYEEESLWKQVLPPMPKGRICPAVITYDNLLLVTGGGAEDVPTLLNTTDVLDLTTMKWTTPEGLDCPVPLWLHHLAFCGEYLYLVGGGKAFDIESPEDYNSQAWRAKWSDVKQTAAQQHSQPQRGVWTQIADPPTLGPTVVSCGGTLYAVGGGRKDIDEDPLRGVYTYNTAGNHWISVGHMSVGRCAHCAVPLSSTTMFVAGGNVINEGSLLISTLTELLLL